MNFCKIHSNKYLIKQDRETIFFTIIDDFNMNIKDKAVGLGKINRKLTVLNDFLQKNISGLAIFTRPELQLGFN